MSATRRATHRLILEFAFTACAAGLLDWVGFNLMQHEAHVATLWPAKGLILALCILKERGQVWPVLAAGFAGSVAAKLLTGDTLLATALASAVSTATVGGIWLCLSHIFAGRIDFRDWKQLLSFILIACAAATLAGLPGAVVATWFRGTDFVAGWTHWSLSTVLSFAILTPPIVLVATRNDIDHPMPDRKRTIAFSLAGIFPLVVAVFAQSVFPISYLVPLALLVVALISEIEGASLALLLTAVVAIACAIAGRGPVATVPGSTASHVLLVQIYLFAVTACILPAAAAITERRSLRDKVMLALAVAKANARARAESEARYRLLADNATDIIICVDAKGTLAYVSPAVRRFGYEPEELLGRTGRALIHPDDLPHFLENTRALLAGDASEAGREHRIRTKSGEWIWLQGNPSILRDAAGNVAGFVNVFRDVTERRAVHAELVAARERAEAAAVAKSEFLANMSHELRTPLTSVIGFADLLHDTCTLDETPKRYADRVRTASRALLATINDILDYSKIESGQIEFAFEPVAPAAHARDVLELFTPQAAAKSLALSFCCASELEEIRCEADPHRLRQVLLNLVGNAVKFTDAGSVSLSLHRVSDAGTHWMRFEIADTGPGIPQDRLDRLFQRFSQVDRSTSRSHGGSGLGLAICRGLVEGMGGRIGVDTASGKGSCFWFEIPFRAILPAGEAHGAGQSAAGGRPRILVADDTQANRVLVRAMLAGMDVDVTDAEDGVRAVALATQAAFDLIVMDIHMPGMNGVAAVQALRQPESASRRARILAFSAEGDRGRTTALLAQGFDGALGKPLDMTELRACVQTMLAACPTDARDPRKVA